MGQRSFSGETWGRRDEGQPACPRRRQGHQPALAPALWPRGALPGGRRASAATAGSCWRFKGDECAKGRAPATLEVTWGLVGKKPEVNSDFVHRTWRQGPAGKCRAEVRCAGPVTVAAVTMLPPRTASLLTLLLAVGSLGQRAQRPLRPPSPISAIQPKANFDAQRFSGTWFLVAVASACRSLQEQGHRAEATTLHVTPQGAAMAVSTFRKLCGSSTVTRGSQVAFCSKPEAPEGRWTWSLGRRTTGASPSCTWSGRGGCR
ncbi:complement component C8 gamma chain isoform X2 [Monodon monoceros]|uniref:complement component C8 gamma chain isoform X2 n=1 Tax=Monodon monoceros TaxID=40151 RepID=UPI0010F6B044|nr:complement component C8 gamma chain isoform X2 [Monodon monoceros]